MFELLNSIPENFGWVMVGFAACACLVGWIKVAKIFVEMWRGNHEEEEEEG